MHEIVSSAVIVVLGACVLACGAGRPDAAARASSVTTGTTAMKRPTEPFRREHAEIKEHLEHLNASLGKLADSSPEEQRGTMRQVVKFIEDHIKPHAEWEERVLYPAVDRRAASGPNPFTASMRHEHRIVARWANELAAELAKPSPDIKAFVRRADNLLGLIWAHFEEEEEVLLPILDRTMSQEQFNQEIGAHAE